MPKKTAYKVRLRRKDTGEEHDRLIFADDAAVAGVRAIERAKMGLIGLPMIDRKYAQFEVISCAPK